MKFPLFLISAALFLTGCSTPTPPVHEYTILRSPVSQASPPAPLAQMSLRIAYAKTLPSIASKNILYLRDGGEVGTYLYSRWSDTPASMIERSLASSLEENRVYAVLLSPASSAQAARILESDLNAFYHRFLSDGTSEGYIDITCRLVDSKTKQTLASRRFRIVQPAPSNDAAGGVHALSAAARELSLQCTRWLIQQIQEKK